jgi:hypothetical protein
MSEEQPVFKVTDRRLFNPDGTPRVIAREEEAAKAETPAAPQPAQAASAGEGRADAASASQASEAAPAAAASPSSAAPPVSSGQAATSEASAGDAERAAPAAAVSPATSSAPAGGMEEFPEDDYAEREIPGADDPASFINFLMSIASNAAAALGMMEHPITGERGVDPDLARHWINVLGMLQQKTRGNLEPQEQQIFEGLLADLRMQYVSLSGMRGQPKTPRGFTGNDITGGR